jgi:hypothetical protein
MEDNGWSQGTGVYTCETLAGGKEGSRADESLNLCLALRIHRVCIKPRTATAADKAKVHGLVTILGFNEPGVKTVTGCIK